MRGYGGIDLTQRFHCLVLTAGKRAWISVTILIIICLMLDEGQQSVVGAYSYSAAFNNGIKRRLVDRLHSIDLVERLRVIRPVKVDYRLREIQR